MDLHMRCWDFLEPLSNKEQVWIKYPLLKGILRDRFFEPAEDGMFTPTEFWLRTRTKIGVCDACRNIKIMMAVAPELTIIETILMHIEALRFCKEVFVPEIDDIPIEQLALTLPYARRLVRMLETNGLLHMYVLIDMMMGVDVL